MRSQKKWASLTMVTRFLIVVLLATVASVLRLTIHSATPSQRHPLVSLSLIDSKTTSVKIVPSVWEPTAKLTGDYLFAKGPFCSSDPPCTLSFPAEQSSQVGSPHALIKTRKGQKGSPNQDRSLLIESGAPGSTRFVLAAVFDGHGARGHESSQQALLQLPFDLLQQPQLGEETKVLTILKESFLRADQSQSTPQAGTTAVLALQIGRSLYLASAGDSTALLVRYSPRRGVTIVAEAVKHKPADPEERKRIEAAGGRIMIPQGASSRVVYRTAQGLDMALAMSRSLGDLDGKGPGYLTAEPSIVVVQDLAQVVGASNPNDDKSFLFLIVASDGVMDMVPTEKVASVLGKALENPDRTALSQACQNLLEQAARQWAVQMMGTYRDDMTLLVTRLYF
jgi:serine/threonine protein phosphatase PrpC